MKVEKYNWEEHGEKLSTWLKLRDLQVPDRRLFSDIGVVVDDKVIGFLFLTNSKQAYIDHLVSDPSSSKSDRESAIYEMIRVLEVEAIKKGCVMITALARFDKVKDKLCNSGYRLYGDFGLYYKVLGDN